MHLILLYLTLIAGFLLRLYNNTAVALWHDEAFSALYIRYDWSEMIHRIILDVHPPLYYMLLKIWGYGAGHSLLSLRLFSIIFGVLTIWAGYKFVRAAFQDKRLALLAAIFIAVNPFQIEYALEARMYTLGTFLALWSSYFLVRALDRQNKKYWIFYSVTAAAAIYTHYFLLFSIAAHGLYVFYTWFKTKNFKHILNSIGAYILILILYLPWVSSFLKQFRQVQASYWIPEMDLWSVPGTIWKMAFGGQGINHLVLLAAVGVSILIIGFYLKRTKAQSKWLVLLSLLVPFAASIAISYRNNLYLDRYFVFAALFFSIIIVGALYHQRNKYFRILSVLAFTVAFLIAFQQNWAIRNIENKPGMDVAAAYLNENAQINDKIYVGSSFVFFTFKYYNQTGIEPKLISGSPLSEIPHFSGTAILTDDDLILNMNETPADQTVWLLWTTGFGANKPYTPPNWAEISEIKYEDTPDFKGFIAITKYQIK